MSRTPVPAPGAQRRAGCPGGEARSWRVVALEALVVVAVPALVVGNALATLLHPWLADALYALPGFPDDRLALDGGQRGDLAGAGVRAVRPFDEGVALLREARLPNGTAAFTEREIAHMADVRAVLSWFAVAWVAALGALLGAGLGLWRLGGRDPLRRALALGGALTAGAIVVLGIVALVDIDGFIAAVHRVLFEGNSWRFADRFTLRHLYPDAFWAIATAAIVALIALQAGALLWLGRPWRSRSAPRSSGGSPAAHAGSAAGPGR